MRSFVALILSASLLLVPAFADEVVDMRATPPGQSSQDCAGHPLLRPIMQTHTIPPYPQVSVMTSEQGTTLLDVTIDAAGVPSDVKIATSSGSARLDEAAQDHVKANWRWQPPLNDCKPVSARTRVSIAWNLRNANPMGGLAALGPAMALDMMNVRVADASDYPVGAPPLTTPALSMVVVMVGMSGKVEAAMLHPGPNPALDAKAIELAKTYHWPQPRMDGKPIGAMYMLMLMWPVPGQPKPDADEIHRVLAMFVPAVAAAQAQPKK